MIERRSDDVLSAFAWASQSGDQRAQGGQHVQPFRQAQDVSMEFNQDFETDASQLTHGTIEKDSRVEHPVFGKGNVVDRRGDVVDILFDSGKRKTLALSIAPLKILT
jgi:hypothetical protein